MKKHYVKVRYPFANRVELYEFDNRKSACAFAEAALANNDREDVPPVERVGSVLIAAE